MCVSALSQCLPHSILYISYFSWDIMKIQMLVQQVWSGPEILHSNQLPANADAVRFCARLPVFLKYLDLH